jgi:hypothetical protein
VTGCGKNYFDNDSSAISVCIGVSSLAINCASLCVNYRVYIVGSVELRKNDRISTVNLVVSATGLADTDSLALCISSRSGNYKPVAPLVTLSSTDFLRIEASVVVATCTRSDLDRNPLAIASVGVVGGIFPRTIYVADSSTGGVNISATAVCAKCGVGTLPLAIAKTGVVDVESPTGSGRICLIKSRKLVTKCRSSEVLNYPNVIASVALVSGEASSLASSGSVGGYVVVVCTTDLCPTTGVTNLKGVVSTNGVRDLDGNEVVIGANESVLTLLANNVAKVCGSTIGVGNNKLACLVDNNGSNAKAVLTVLTVLAVSTSGTGLALFALVALNALSTLRTSLALASNQNCTDHEAHH